MLNKLGLLFFFLCGVVIMLTPHFYPSINTNIDTMFVLFGIALSGFSFLAFSTEVIPPPNNK